MQPIYFENETIDWLGQKQSEWPPTLQGDLDKIDKHNQKVRSILGHLSL